MKNQNNHLSVKNRISILATLLTLSTHVFGASNSSPLRRWHVNRFLGRLKHTALTLEQNASYRETKRFQDELNFLWDDTVNQALFRNPAEKITVNGKDYPALAYSILLGRDYLLTNSPKKICPPIYHGNYNQDHDKRITWWLQQEQNSESLLELLSANLTEKDQNTVAQAMLYRGLLEVIGLIPDVLLRPTSNGFLLFDIAKIQNGETKIRFGQADATTTADLTSISTALSSYLIDLQSVLAERSASITRDDDALKSAVCTYYATHGDLKVIRKFDTIKLKEMCRLRGNREKFQQEKAQHQAISKAIVSNFEHLSPDDRRKTLENACLVTDVNAIYQFLISYIDHAETPYETIDKKQKWQHKQIKDLKKMLVHRGHKTRTPLLHVMRNAYGSERKKCLLAKTEDTVRALLMLIVAGADLDAKDSYGIRAAQFPFNSLLSLFGCKPKEHANSFIFDKLTGNPVDSHNTEEKSRLIDANLLLQHVLGCSSEFGYFDNKLIQTAEVQKLIIEKHIYSAQHSDSGSNSDAIPLSKGRIKKYLKQRRSMLDTIKEKSLEDLVNFASTAQNKIVKSTFASNINITNTNYANKMNEIVRSLTLTHAQS